MLAFLLYNNNNNNNVPMAAPTTPEPSSLSSAFSTITCPTSIRMFFMQQVQQHNADPSSTIPTTPTTPPLSFPSSFGSMHAFLYTSGQRIVPILNHIAAISERIQQLIFLFLSTIQPIYLTTLLFFSFLTVPLGGFFYCTYYYYSFGILLPPPTTNSSSNSSSSSSTHQQYNNNNDTKHKKHGIQFVPYVDSWTYQIADHVSQISKIAAIAYWIDCTVTVVLLASVEYHHTEDHDHDPQHYYYLRNLSQAVAKVSYIVWFAYRLVLFKKYLLNKVYELFVFRNNNNTNSTNATATTNNKNNSNNTAINTTTSSSCNNNKNMNNNNSNKTKKSIIGQISIIDRFLNGIIVTMTLVLLLDIIDVELGMDGNVKNSLYAITSISTVVLTLASRDVATMFVNGLTLVGTNRISIGDNVKFGDGTVGVIDNIGWIQTTIRHYDNIIEIVPNSELGMQRVKNISRTHSCRVQQVLRFHYEDALKLPKVLDDIIEEIKVSCPELISDGSRPLRAVWTEYCETYLKVVVTAHFTIKPIGKQFQYNRQQCLLAIFRAVARNDIQFVTTVSLEQNKNKKHPHDHELSI